MKAMKSWSRAVVLVGFAALALCAALPAAAHAKLDSTLPAAGSTVVSPKLIQVHFDEAIETKLSKVTLAASDGTAVAVMAMNDAKDPASLAIMPNEALKAGRYTVTWSVVSDDGHKRQGSFSFTVR